MDIITVKKIRLALAQINPVVGDLSGNVKKIISYIKKARRLKADIIVFPELAVTGYPPEDLLLKPQFVKDNINALNEVKEASENITAITGFVDINKGLYNAAAIISNKRLIDVYRKKHLPNYGVFDEHRYFKSGSKYPVYDFSGVNIGINICEDIWYKDTTKIQALSGAEVIININASPYNMGKASLREKIVSKKASDNNVIIVYLNMVGGQDELVFDGGSFVVDRTGRIIAKGGQFGEELIPVDLEIEINNLKGKKRSRTLPARRKGAEKIKIPSVSLKARRPLIKIKKAVELTAMEEVYSALLLGTKDYVYKNGFNGVVIGLSGGIDSALVAAIAVDALGKEKVQGLFMPSQYTSKESYEDVHALAGNLGIKIIDIPINSILKKYLKILEKEFKGTGTDATEENLQARIRGNILMAFSNKFGWLVLTTGNKSEMSMGYATLYGDMAGGFAVIKDVPKTMVYELCKFRNDKEGRALLPDRLFWKEPSAELRHDQRDTDTLPPYPVLDPILKAYIEDDLGFDEIKKMGCEIKCAQNVISMIDHSEYKRRQAPPGIKITPRAFGRDRRFPITNKYKSY